MNPINEITWDIIHTDIFEKLSAEDKALLTITVGQLTLKPYDNFKTMYYTRDFKYDQTIFINKFIVIYDSNRHILEKIKVLNCHYMNNLFTLENTYNMVYSTNNTLGKQTHVSTMNNTNTSDQMNVNVNQNKGCSTTVVGNSSVAGSTDTNSKIGNIEQAKIAVTPSKIIDTEICKDKITNMDKLDSLFHDKFSVNSVFLDDKNNSSENKDIHIPDNLNLYAYSVNNTRSDSVNNSKSTILNNNYSCNINQTQSTNNSDGNTDVKGHTSTIQVNKLKGFNTLISVKMPQLHQEFWSAFNELFI